MAVSEARQKICAMYAGLAGVNVKKVRVFVEENDPEVFKPRHKYSATVQYIGETLETQGMYEDMIIELGKTEAAAEKKLHDTVKAIAAKRFVALYDVFRDEDPEDLRALAKKAQDPKNWT